MTVVVLLAVVVVVATSAAAFLAFHAERNSAALPSRHSKGDDIIEKHVEMPRVAAARVDPEAWALASRAEIAAALPEVGDAADGSVALGVDAPVVSPGTVAASTPVSLNPETSYTLSASVRVLQSQRTPVAASINVGGQQFLLPELDARWKKVEFRFTTPEAGWVGNLELALAGPVRGLGIDAVSLSGADGVDVVANGSFERTSGGSGILNDSLVLSEDTATLAVALPEGELTWTATSTDGGPPIRGKGTISSPLAAVPLNEVQPGHYSLEVTDASGRAIQTAIAVIDTAGPFMNQDPRLGVVSHVERDYFAGTGSLAAALGFSMVRNDVVWEKNEKVKGQYVFDPVYDREFARLHANGLGLLGVVVHGNKVYSNTRWPEGPATIDAFGKYAAAIADRYDLVGLEVYNEFNHHEYNKTACGRSPECYIPMLEAVQGEVKAKHPNLPIVGGASALYDQEWFQGLWAAGGLSLIDVASYHPYEAWMSRDPDLVGEVARRSYEDMRAGTGQTKPVWISEMGFTSMNPGGVTLAEQREMLIRSEVSAFANGVEKYFWYDLVNDSSDIASGEGNFGLYERDPRPGVVALAPKPAGQAQAVMVAELGGRAFAGAESDDATAVYVFGDDDDAVRVAWATSGETERVFKADRPVTVVSATGGVVELVPDGGEVVVPLTGSPVFIEGISAQPPR